MEDKIKLIEAEILLWEQSRDNAEKDGDMHMVVHYNAYLRGLRRALVILTE